MDILLKKINIQKLRNIIYIVSKEETVFIMIESMQNCDSESSDQGQDNINILG